MRSSLFGKPLHEMIAKGCSLRNPDIQTIKPGDGAFYIPR